MPANSVDLNSSNLNTLRSNYGHANKPGPTAVLKAQTQWSLASKSILEKRTRLAMAVDSMNSAIHQPKEASFLGVAQGQEEYSNVASLMRPDSTALEEYGISSDFVFGAMQNQRDNTMMQVCIWDDSRADSAVSGCINLKTVFNINTETEKTGISTQLSIHAINRNRFETMREAVNKDCVLKTATANVCDVFNNNTTVVFKQYADPVQEVIMVHSNDKDPAQPQYVHVNTTWYNASREPCAIYPKQDLDIQRVEVSYNEDVNTKQLIAESLFVHDKVADLSVCYVMSNVDVNLHAEKDNTVSIPKTAAHVFGLGYNLVGSSKNNILAQGNYNVPTEGRTVAHALACIRSLAQRATLADKASAVAKAFNVCHTDPSFTHSRIASIATHPGLRIMCLDIAGNIGVTGVTMPRKVCVVLSSVMDCKDMDVAHLHHKFMMAQAVTPNKLDHVVRFADVAAYGAMCREVTPPTVLGGRMRKMWQHAKEGVKKVQEGIVKHLGNTEWKEPLLKIKDQLDQLGRDLEKIAHLHHPGGAVQEGIESNSGAQGDMSQTAIGSEHSESKILRAIEQIEDKLSELDEKVDEITRKQESTTEEIEGIEKAVEEDEDEAAGKSGNGNEDETEGDGYENDEEKRDGYVDSRMQAGGRIGRQAVACRTNDKENVKPNVNANVKPNTAFFMGPMLLGNSATTIGTPMTMHSSFLSDLARSARRGPGVRPDWEW
eukprot:141487-Rhodomonas_salina.1